MAKQCESKVAKQCESAATIKLIRIKEEEVAPKHRSNTTHIPAAGDKCAALSQLHDLGSLHRRRCDELADSLSAAEEGRDATQLQVYPNLEEALRDVIGVKTRRRQRGQTRLGLRGQNEHGRREN